MLSFFAGALAALLALYSLERLLARRRRPPARPFVPAQLRRDPLAPDRPASERTERLRVVR